MKPDVLSLGNFPKATMVELDRRFTLHHFADYTLPPPGLKPEVAARVRAIATEANRGANRALIAVLPKLEVISAFGVGIDAIDLEAAREHSIPLTNTPGILADEVADLAIGLMLASARQILIADSFVRNGNWAKGPISFGRSVGGKTMGVVGLGGIGRAIADRGAAFRMRVLYHGPRPKPDAPYAYVPDLIELARQSNYLMVACKGGPATRHLVSAAVMRALGPWARWSTWLAGRWWTRRRWSGRWRMASWGSARSTCSRTSPMCRRSCWPCPTRSCSRTTAAPPPRHAPPWGSS